MQGGNRSVKYQANTFTMNFPDQWQDRTVYTIAGPVADGLQHNVTITVGQDVPFTSVREFAEWQIATTEREVKGCRLLKKGTIALANGMPAYQAIYVWFPTEGLKVYNEQIFVLAEGCAYTLTATFSKKSRKALGPPIERTMLSFEPSHTKPKTTGRPA